MSTKAKYIITSILYFGLTYGGSAGVVVLNYVQENSASYKITLTGIILTIALFFYAKHRFEQSYRRKLDNALQNLASATDTNVKTEINKEINELKRKQDIYQSLLTLMPFMIIYIITWLGQSALESLQATTGFLLLFLGSGSACNLARKPLQEKYKQEKLIAKVNKKYSKA